MNTAVPLRSDAASRVPAVRVDVFAAVATAALLLFFSGCAIYASVHRGPWLDEMWTIWQGQHDQPLAEIVWLRWIPDLHPPLFAITHWLAGTFIVDSLPLHRLLNLLPLAWAALFGWVAARRYPAVAGMLVVYGIVMLSLPAAADYSAESRSYFTQLCLTYVVCGGLIAVALSGDEFDASRDGAYAAMLLATILAGINLHYVFALLIGTVTFGFCVLLAWQRRWRWAIALMVALLIGSLALLAFLRVQAPFIEQESAHHWVTNTTWEAVRVLRGRVRAVLWSNPIVTLAAFISVLSVAAALLPGRWTNGGSPTVLDRDFATRLAVPRAKRPILGILVASLVLFCVGMLIVHGRHPVVSERYLLPFQGTVAAVLACLAGEAVASRRLLVALAVALAVFGTQREIRSSSHQERWDSTASVVAQRLATCPSSSVVAGIVPRPSVWINSHTVFEWAFHYVGRRHGFDIDYVKLPRPELARPDDKCPVVFWSEHVVTGIPSDVEGAVRALGIDGSRVDRNSARLYPGQTGFVLTFMPLPASQVPPKAEPAAVQR